MTKKKSFLTYAAIALAAAAFAFLLCILFNDPPTRAERLKQLGEDMEKAVEEEDYEQAAVLRDEIKALTGQGRENVSL